MSASILESGDKALHVDGKVLPEWIDFNGHMNVAYYLLAFDRAIDVLWDHVGITREYVRLRRLSTFAVETHVSYQQELRAGDSYRIVTQLIALDDKRLHQFQYMIDADAGHLAATAEWLNLHVNLETRRVCPWPDEIRDSFTAIARAQLNTDIPEEAGRQIRIQRPLYALQGYGAECRTLKG